METQNELNNSNRSMHPRDLIMKLWQATRKRSFLVFAQDKYFPVPVEKIAFFRIKSTSCIIHCLDSQEYSINYSLEQIESILCNKQFFRLNRQYLLNFQAVKEVEPFYGRKLIVNLIIPVDDALLVSTDKVNDFLNWLDNR